MGCQLAVHKDARFPQKVVVALAFCHQHGEGPLGIPASIGSFFFQPPVVQRADLLCKRMET